VEVKTEAKNMGTDSLKLPWNSYEYTKWLNSFNDDKANTVSEYFSEAISKWHSNFGEFYDKSKYDNKSTFSLTPVNISSVVFCARGGAAFACELAEFYLQSYFKEQSINTLKNLNFTVKNDSQVIEYNGETLYIFVTYSGTTTEIIESFKSLITNFNASTAEDKQLSVMIITSDLLSQTFGKENIKYNKMRVIYNAVKTNTFDNIFDETFDQEFKDILNKMFAGKFSFHLITLLDTPFYQRIHSIQPYLLFSGIMKGSNQIFSLSTSSKTFDVQFKEDINEAKKDNKCIERINTSVLLASKILEKGMPYIYCDSNTYVIAKRMQTVINENAKILSSVDYISEIQHNHIIPWTMGRFCCSVPIFIPSNDPETIENMRIVETKLASDISDLPHNTFEFVKDKMSENKKLFLGLYASDLLSVRLSILRGVDPSDNLKIYSMKNLYSRERSPEYWEGSSDLNATINRYTDVKTDLERTKSDLNCLIDQVDEIKDDTSGKLDALEHRVLQIFSAFAVVITISVTVIVTLMKKFETPFTVLDFLGVMIIIVVAIIVIFIILFLFLQWGKNKELKKKRK
jgi:hypothetical protein